jgi:hypothetical protein
LGKQTFPSTKFHFGVQSVSFIGVPLILSSALCSTLHLIKQNEILLDSLIRRFTTRLPQDGVCATICGRCLDPRLYRTDDGANNTNEMIFINRLCNKNTCGSERFAGSNEPDDLKTSIVSHASS